MSSRFRCRSGFVSGVALAAVAFLAAGCQSRGRGAGDNSTGTTSPGGKTGVAAWPVSIANLSTRNIVFTNNTVSNGMNACGLLC